MNQKKEKIPVSRMVESIVGCKWSLRVLEMIQSNICRPGEMQRQTPGLSAKVLNERLSKLMRFGIIQKTIHPVVPPHVDYQLTDFGEKFSLLLKNIEELQEEVDS